MRPRRSEVSQRRGAPCYPRPAGQDARQTVFLPATGLLRSGPSNARGEAPAFLFKTSRTAHSRKNLHAAIPSSRGRSIAGIVRPSGPGCSAVKAKATDARSASSMTRRVVTTGRAVVVARDLSKRDATPRRAEPGGERENRNETADSVAEAEHGVRQFCRDTALFKQTRRTAPRHGAGAGRPSPTNARAQERRETGPGSFRRPNAEQRRQFCLYSVSPDNVVAPAKEKTKRRPASAKASAGWRRCRPPRA